MRSLVLATLAVLLAASPVAAAASPCVTVDGLDPEPARQALADRGIGGPSAGCAPSRLALSAHEVGVTWTLTRPDGVVAARNLASTEVGAAWVDSMLHPRLAGLLTPADPAGPELPSEAGPPDALRGDAPQLEGAGRPEASGARRVQLYATFEEWRDRKPTAEVEAGLTPRTVDEHLVGERGLEPMWAVDRTRKEGRADGPVFALEVDGELYVNESAPPTHRGRVFGRVERVGDRGVYQKKVCYWVPRPDWNPSGVAGYLECDVDLRLVDLGSGDVTPLNRKRLKELLAAHPELLADFRAEKKKHAGTMRRYAVAALRADGE